MPGSLQAQIPLTRTPAPSLSSRAAENAGFHEMLLFRSYSTLQSPSPNPQHGPAEALCSPSDCLCTTSPPNTEGTGDLHSPVVLPHSSAEGTSHTLLYKPSFSLISPVAHKPRQCTCPDVPERGKPKTGVRKSLFQGKARIQRTHTMFSLQALCLSLTSEVRGKGVRLILIHPETHCTTTKLPDNTRNAWCCSSACNYGECFAVPLLPDSSKGFNTHFNYIFTK